MYYQIFHCIFKSCFYNDLGRKSRVEGKKGAFIVKNDLVRKIYVEKEFKYVGKKPKSSQETSLTTFFNVQTAIKDKNQLFCYSFRCHRDQHRPDSISPQNTQAKP